jgi:EAL domain-containing protein (putative c-di-GMP-specific phosphodiesterase class I)/ActR/RegA family two-component response regulator
MGESVAEPTHAGAWTPGRVLVVDDEPLLLAVYRKLLTSAGWTVETASSGAEAKALASGDRFDVIVSDVRMPGMTGVDLLRAVRERDLDVPVVLLTGNPDVDSAAEAVEYGAFRYLGKPVDSAKLLEVLRRGMQLHRLAKLKRQALAIVGSDGRSLEDRAAVEERFHNALANLWIAYQPIVSWRSKRVHGYEALVRSAEPTLPSPRDLFDAAERLGQLHLLGRAIRQHVAVDAERAPSDCRLFVNVHAADLDDPDLYSSSAPLSDVARRVVLEITERYPLEAIDGLHARVASLRALGFQIAVDDLGAGYAGLSCFTLLGPDVVKLDMSLIRAIQTSKRKRSIVKSMIDLASGELGMLVVCEGVETVEERDTLAQLGADLFQGYLVARPERQFVAIP